MKLHVHELTSVDRILLEMHEKNRDIKLFLEAVGTISREELYKEIEYQRLRANNLIVIYDMLEERLKKQTS